LIGRVAKGGTTTDRFLSEEPVSTPLLLGHRGARPLRCLGLRWRRPGFPVENTLAAFDYAMASGCDGFEFDVRYTRDRRSVLSHDPKLHREEVALAEYAGLERRSGYNLACLEDVLKRFCETAYLDIELKVTGNEESVVAALRANPPRRGYVLSSFLPQVLLRLHELDPSLLLGYLCEREEDMQRWKQLSIAAFAPQYSLLSQGLIDEVHARGMKLFTWTVNDEHELLRLASWGVDGLISDDPRLLARTFSRQHRTTSSHD
jgi:glycerophosphoryl diester phosphodiesterase